MKLLLKRNYLKPTYTIGRLYVDGIYVCDTLEDTDRGLSCSMPLTKITFIKVPNETAIPTGSYSLDMNTVSPKYSTSSFFKTVCNGKVPRLVGVPGFEGILIHTGNSPLDTSGCILVGYNTVSGKLTDSRSAFKKLYKLLKEAHSRSESISIEISY